MKKEQGIKNNQPGFKASLLSIGQCYDLKSLEKGTRIIGKILKNQKGGNAYER